MRAVPDTPYDLLVIGAGIHGAGIARDAAGRGLRVLLVESGDIAGATSSASTKLIHGGLRYLEHYAFGLVREALAEREVLLANAPHLVREQRFVVPHQPALRPAWMVRLGLALYDRLAGRGASLARAEALALGGTAYGLPLKPDFTRGFAYSDLATDDARLTLLNVVSAAQLGARVLTRVRCVGARRTGTLWRAVLQEADGTQHECAARIVVNAAGPWVARLRQACGGPGDGLRLVQGSHIVVPRLYAGEHAYLFQQADGRVVFAIPFEGEFTLIGTTDVALGEPRARPAASREEIEYLCAAASAFLAQPVLPAQVCWSFAGMRALYDDGHSDPASVRRESHLALDGAAGEPPLLSIYGGKLSTYRRLAERALERLRPWLAGLRPAWTAAVHLPGGGLGPSGLPGLLLELSRRHPKLPPDWLHALARRHGTRAKRVIGPALGEADLGPCFGAGLYGIEVDYMLGQEWAREAEDILWRRTKCGLKMNEAARGRLADYMEERAFALRAPS